jgi:hypothetical protein
MIFVGCDTMEIEMARKMEVVREMEMGREMEMEMG